MNRTVSAFGSVYPTPSAFIATPARSCPDCPSIGSTLCHLDGEFVGCSIEFATPEAAEAALAEHAERGCVWPEIEQHGATMYAADLRPGDLVVDETGARKFAAFDVEHGDPVRVWTGNADRSIGWPSVLTFLPGDRLLVVRSA